MESEEGYKNGVHYRIIRVVFDDSPNSKRHYFSDPSDQAFSRKRKQDVKDNVIDMNEYKKE